ARLAHPNVLAVHEVGRWHEFVYITMELLDGGTLRGWQSAPDRRWPEIVAAYQQAARGLHAAHVAGLVHRDFKPDNVLIGSAPQGERGIGRVRVGDFGLARSAEEVGDAIVGTPGYMAPELLHDRGGSPLADQFSFGVSLFEALCGYRPYGVRDAWAAQWSDLRWPPDRLPTWLADVIVRAVELDPRARFGDLDALETALAQGLARAARRRRWLIGGGIVALTATLGVAFGSRLATPLSPSCGEAAVLRVWDEARANELGDAFARTGSPIHEQAATEVRARLDAWSSEWITQRLEACHAAQGGVQTPLVLERRNACLDRRLAELAVAVDALRIADRDTVAHAIDLVADLRPLATCTDVDRLLAAVAPPDDPVLAEEVERAHADLDRANAAAKLGRTLEARARAEEVRDRDAAARFPQLRAEASLLLGTILGQAHEYTDSELALEQAFRDALSVGDDALVADATRELVCSAAAVDGGSDRARRWVPIAESAADRVAKPEHERIDLRYCEALMHHRAGEYELADLRLREAIALADRAPPGSLVPGLLHDLRGLVLQNRAHADEARREHELAFELIAAARGPTHPAAVVARSHLGSALGKLGNPGAEVALQLVALQAAIELHGDDSAAALPRYEDLALALRRINAGTQATAYLEVGVALASARPGQQRVLAELLVHLAEARLERDEIAAAVELAQRGVAASESAWGAGHVNGAAARSALAEGLVRSGRVDEALAEHLSALALLDAKLGPASRAAGVLHLNLASELHYAGRVDREQHAAAAERAAIASGDRVLEAGVASVRATIARERGDFRGARVLQAQAVALLEGVNAVHLRKELFRLGADDMILGDPAIALQAFMRSRELAEAAGNETRVAASELAMARARWAMGDEAEALTLANAAVTRYVALSDEESLAEARAWFATPRRRGDPPS
ncbi:MAG TPA: protein kinase, partial [Nannocystaceae bacterium]|nr:protein kinase [Nannocystaceae bacterium]